MMQLVTTTRGIVAPSTATTSTSSRPTTPPSYEALAGPAAVAALETAPQNRATAALADLENFPP